jgi:hypothetical protein
MNRTQLLNYLVERHNLQSYCEIGLQNPANNFNKIQCKVKCSVDPDPNAKAKHPCTSDEFFASNKTYFSLYFIDGWHEAGQVKRDFENALRWLTDDGYIVIHDVLPDEQQYTTVPRVTKRWFGSVYKFCLNLKSYDGIDFITYNFDCGCCVVWKDPTKKGTGTVDTSWENYKLNGRELMNVKDSFP